MKRLYHRPAKELVLFPRLIIVELEAGTGSPSGLRVAHRVFSCSRAAEGENLYEHQAGDETPDVRGISHTTLLRAAA